MVLFLLLLSCQTNHAHELIPPNIRKLALDDRNILNPIDFNTTYYLYLPTKNLITAQQFTPVLNFVVASSSSNQILDYCTPKQLFPDIPLWRINLTDLKWSTNAFHTVLSSYPYSYNNTNPLFIRGDWLVSQLTDTSTSSSEAYYRLLYGKTSKNLTRNEILSFWGVATSSNLSFGLIENDSGVSVSKTRIIENRPTLRGYTWGTFDAVKNDPFDDILPPFTNFKHEAEEWIVGAPKFALKTNPPITGVLQYYFLANANGKVLASADPALVEDRSRFRDNSQIRAPGSCIQCHIQGINQPSKNALRELITKGADIYADKKTQQQLELFHLLPLTREIRDNNDRFQTIQKYLTKMEPDEFLEAFRKVVSNYDKPVSLAQAGEEVNFKALHLAFGSVSNSTPTLQLNPRLVGLAHNIPISRQNWEKLYNQAIKSVKLFKKEL